MNIWKVQLSINSNIGEKWGDYYILADGWDNAVKEANRFCKTESDEDKVLLKITGLKESLRVIVPPISCVETVNHGDRK